MRMTYRERGRGRSAHTRQRPRRGRAESRDRRRGERARGGRYQRAMRGGGESSASASSAELSYVVILLQNTHTPHSILFAPLTRAKSRHTNHQLQMLHIIDTRCYTLSFPVSGKHASIVLHNTHLDASSALLHITIYNCKLTH